MSDDSDTEYRSDEEEPETRRPPREPSKKVVVAEGEDDRYASDSEHGESDDDDDELDDIDDDIDDEEKLFGEDDDELGVGAKKAISTLKLANNPSDLTTKVKLFDELDDNLDDISEDEVDDDDDEDEYNDNYLQKFNDSMRKNIITEHHQELMQHSYEEIEAMCTVVRSDGGIIVDPFHRTLPILTKYEKARILGERAQQLSYGAKPFIKLDESIIDEYLIATKELAEQKLPFIIKRPLPNGGCEYWRLSDLEVL